ncbi:hypothetical protein FOB72_28175 [Cupriavidus pauculus]|uniref:Uncharacterized protein n=1 Tax=Cupriavidus pauculus TaxID=82633 RepID=A0A5P2HC52_9BURK|nr:hypothetical protein [Cupriavidus pauculus]QET05837.1 hypothetical protein FOB72_28175 [Cupriavidus pauculus]
MVKMDNCARLAAFENVKKSINFDALLPEFVFSGAWRRFLFCESDRIFGKHFIDAVTELMCLEDGTVSCIVNLDATPVLEFESVAAIYIDRVTTVDEYNEALRSGGPGNGWLYRVDRYVCVSDAGAWCIYCEKSNDVAVIALRDDAHYERFHGPLGQLWAKPIKELVEGGASALFPFDHLVPEWRKALLENYGDGQQCKPR